MNSTLELMKNRVSLRKYADKPLAKEHIDAIIEGAMRAPTAGNMMLYSILMIEDKETKLKLSKTCDNQPFIADAPLVLIFLADMQRWFDYYDHCGVGEYCQKHGLEYRGPHKGDFILASSDAAIAAQNAVIAAESLGIGSCYIGDIIENYEVHREMLNLPDWAFPVAMLCFGYYPDGMARIPRSRFDRKYVVFDEKYRRLSHEEFEDMYKEREKMISKENRYGAENLGQFIYMAKTSSEFSKEMSRSANVALENWKGEKTK